MRDFKTKSTPPKTNDAECIVSLKVYDSCKRQVRLSPLEIGSARSVEDICIGEEYHEVGDTILPPEDSISVSVDNFKIKRVVVENKQPNTSKAGYWDINIKFVFEYQVSFEKEVVCDQIVQEEDHCNSKNILASSSYNMMVTLFGSQASDFVVGTDLKSNKGKSKCFPEKPCVRVNSSAFLVQSELEYSEQSENSSSCDTIQPSAVLVTIGLDTTISLYRLISSKGGFAWLSNAKIM